MVGIARYSQVLEQAVTSRRDVFTSTIRYDTGHWLGRPPMLLWSHVHICCRSCHTPGETASDFSLEHEFLTGATCPACLKHFWTTQRLQQCVSRRTGRNDCFQTLMKAGFKGEYTRISMPQGLDGLNRANWVQAYRPQACRKDLHISAMAQCEEEIPTLEQRCHVPEMPSNADVLKLLKQTLLDQLRGVTCLWFHDSKTRVMMLAPV